MLWYKRGRPEIALHYILEWEWLLGNATALPPSIKYVKIVEKRGGEKKISLSKRVHGKTLQIEGAGTGIVVGSG